MDLRTLESNFLLAEKQYHQRFGEKKVYDREMEKLRLAIDELSSDIQLLDQTLIILQKVSTSIQENFLRTLESLVSEGLTAVFDESIKFKIAPSVKNNIVHLDFELENVDGIVTDIVDARGGGLISFCSVLLRILVVRLLAPFGVRQVVFLDESLGMLSDGYVPAAGEFLSKLAMDLNIQILLVTHQRDLADYADMAYELKRSSTGDIIAVGIKALSNGNK